MILNNFLQTTSVNHITSLVDILDHLLNDNISIDERAKVKIWYIRNEHNALVLWLDVSDETTVEQILTYGILIGKVDASLRIGLKREQLMTIR